MGKLIAHTTAPEKTTAPPPRLVVITDQARPEFATLATLAYRAGWTSSVLAPSRGQRPPHTALTLIDGRRLPSEELAQTIRQWHSPHSTLALLLADDQCDGAVDWLALPNLRAVFLDASDPDQLWRGLLAAWQGENWLPRRLLDRYLADQRRQQADGAALLLTPREQEVLRLIAQAATNAEIAMTLLLSEHTVKTHIYNLFRKLGVKNRVEAINRARFALPAGLESAAL